MNEINKIEKILTRCNENKPITNQEIKEYFLAISEQIQKQSLSINHLEETSNQLTEKINLYQEQTINLETSYESIQNEISVFQNNCHTSFAEIRRTSQKEIEKVQKDMKHFLAQYEVEFGIIDEYCYLFVNRFQVQTNEEFSKIYQILRQKNIDQKNLIFNQLTFENNIKTEKFKETTTNNINWKKCEEFEEKTLESMNKIKSIGKSMKSTKNSQKRNNKLSKYHQESKMFKSSKDWIHPQCFHFTNIVFEFYQMVATNNQTNVFLFGVEPLENEFCFHLRFDAIGENVSLGIGDLQYASLSKTGESCPNIIEYTNDAYLYANGRYAKKQGHGYKVGEKVTISGCLKQGQIKFSVENEVRCSYEWDKLKDKNVEWVPYIVFDNEDAVSLVNFGL